MGYKGGFQFVPYREIAPPPSDETASLTLIRSVIERHVGRLNDLLAEHEEIEAAEAAARNDRAVLDCSTEFERHRRYQSARRRELLRTLETLRKMRKEEFGTGNGEAEKADGKCQVADDKCQVADDKCQVADDEWQMANDECQVAEGKLQVAGGEPKSPIQNHHVSPRWRGANCRWGRSSARWRRVAAMKGRGLLLGQDELGGGEPPRTTGFPSLLDRRAGVTTRRAS